LPPRPAESKSGFASLFGNKTKNEMLIQDQKYLGDEIPSPPIQLELRQIPSVDKNIE
jgi:hypothetical protein